MQASILIDSFDIGMMCGVWLEQGGLSKFEVPPTPKVTFFNEWVDESGRDYDTSSPVVYDPRTIEVPFLIIGSSMADYRKKKRDFLALIVKNGDLDFQIIDWGETYRLRYVATVSWDFINESLDAETSARAVIRFEDNHGTPSYIFKYLADNLGRYIVINGGEKILVKTSL